MKTIIEKKIIANGNKVILKPIVHKLYTQESYSTIIVTVENNQIQVVLE